MPQVTVLLATYNGSKYVRQMIDSVLAQTYTDFHLILSDDSSKDDTPQILEEYAQKHPKMITHYRSGVRFGNAQNHFMHLLEQFHDTPYIMFCDQDDVWHADKMQKTYDLMKSTEDDGIPALVHTDLRVVDGSLQQIAPSFCRHSGVRSDRLALRQLLVQNVVTGCTMMINRPLAVLACKNYDAQAMRMHDWWLALLASACGRIAFLPESTIDYRQHGNNSVGAKNVHSPAYLWQRLRSKSMRGSMRDGALQARAFLRCYKNEISRKDQDLIAAFAATADASWLKRNQIYLTNGLLKYGFIRIAAQLLGW